MESSEKNAISRKLNAINDLEARFKTPESTMTHRTIGLGISNLLAYTLNSKKILHRGEVALRIHKQKNMTDNATGKN